MLSVRKICIPWSIQVWGQVNFRIVKNVLTFSFCTRVVAAAHSTSIRYALRFLSTQFDIIMAISVFLSNKKVLSNVNLHYLTLLNRWRHNLIFYSDLRITKCQVPYDCEINLFAKCLFTEQPFEKDDPNNCGTHSWLPHS